MGGPTRVRHRRIRVADNLDDQKTPSQIALAIPSSVTEEDLQVFYLSRLREVIFGSPGLPVKYWYDDFQSQGIYPLRALSYRRVGVGLDGTRDGVNRIFTVPLPDKFLHDPAVTKQTIEVFHNGRRLAQGPLGAGEYLVLESGGVGTGFDAINLLSFAPREMSVLVANYQLA